MKRPSINYAYSWKHDTRANPLHADAPVCVCCGASLPALALFDTEGCAWGRDCFLRASGAPVIRCPVAKIAKRYGKVLRQVPVALDVTSFVCGTGERMWMAPGANTTSRAEAEVFAAMAVAAQAKAWRAAVAAGHRHGAWVEPKIRLIERNRANEGKTRFVFEPEMCAEAA